MEKLYSKILGTLVIAETGMRPVATVFDLVMDPDRGLLLALVVNTSKKLVVSPIDIVFWGDVLRIADVSMIIETDDLVKLQEPGLNERQLIKKKVFTVDGDFLGKVVDFALDTQTLMLQKLFVSKEFWGLVRLQSFIIPANKIVEVTEEKIVVKGNLEAIKQEAEEAKVPPKVAIS